MSVETTGLKKTESIEENCVSKEDEKKKRLILELRKLLNEHPTLKHLNCEDAYLERFLAAADYNIEIAFDKIRQFYELLIENPTWFAMESPTEKKWLIQRDVNIVLNGCDKEGRQIFILKSGNLDANKMDFVRDIVHLEDIYCEGMFVNNMGPSTRGICTIVDINNFSIKLAKWATPHNIITCLKRIYSMPVKDFRYHVVNSSIWVDIVLKLIWPFLPQDVKNQVCFHFNDYEALHEHIDKEVLPEEYGGTQTINTNELQRILLDNDSIITGNFTKNRKMFLESISH